MGNGLQQEDPLRLLLEKDAVISTTNRLFRAVDERDWDAMERCFAPSVVLDMTSLAGGEPQTMTPSEIGTMWGQALGGMKAVHHQVGNYEVAVHGLRAHATCYGTAYHYLPGGSGHDVRRFVGTYDVELAKRQGAWCVQLLRYNVKFVDGNLDLEGNETEG
jgi:hypothetical protein